MAVKLADWEAKGVELFGEDRCNWRFVCPSCGDVQSVNTAKKNYPELKGKGWAPAQECIGRYLEDAGCNWCSYGLFRGPLLIELEDGKEVGYFDFDGKPYTKKAEG